MQNSISSFKKGHFETAPIPEEVGPKLRILHVDDNLDFSNLFTMGFKKWFDVSSVSSGKIALTMLKEGTFDAVITDYDMPDMDGITLLRAIKNLSPNFPVIFYTGQGNEQVAREAFLAGANDYFIKEYRGFSFKDRLVNSVRHAVERSRTEVALLRERSLAQKYFDRANVIMLIYNTDYSIRMINRYGCDLLGYNEEEILGKNWGHLALPQETRVRMQQDFDRLVTEERHATGRYENEIITKSGERRLVTWQNTFLRDEHGKIDGVLGSGVDITDLKENELRIKHLNRVLKAIRNINKIIVGEQKIEDLIRKSCQNLVSTGGYESAFIILIHRDGSFKTAEQSGINPIQFREMEANFSQNVFPTCISNALNSGEMFLVADSKNICDSHSLVAHFCRESRIVVPLKTSERIHGTLVVCFPPTLRMDDEEKELLKELSDDIAYAIENIYVRMEHEEFENALVESEKRYRTIFDSAHDAIIIQEKESEVLIDANNRAREMFDIEKSLTGFVIRNASLGPLSRKSTREIFKNANIDETQGLEWQLTTKDGKTIWAEINLKQTTLKGRSCIMTTIRDITPRKESERIVRESEENYRTIFNAGSDAIYLRDAISGELLEANTAMMEMFDLTPRELTNLRIDDFSIGIHPFTGERARSYFEKAAAGEPQNLEWLLTSKKGRIFWAELTMRSAVIRGRKCVITNLHDITDRKNMEERIKESEESYRAIFEASNDAIIVRDAETGAPLEANSQYYRMFGYSPDEIQMLTVNHFCIQEHPYTGKEKWHYFRKAATGEPQVVEWLAQDKAGRQFWIEISERSQVIRGRTCVVSSYRDINERKVTEDNYRTIFEVTPDALIVCNPENGDALHCNQRMFQLFGYTPEEINSLPLLAFLADKTEENADLVSREFEKVLKGEIYQKNWYAQNKAGKRFWINCQAKQIAFRGKNTILLSIRDISDQQEAENDRTPAL